MAATEPGGPPAPSAPPAPADPAGPDGSDGDGSGFAPLGAAQPDPVDEPTSADLARRGPGVSTRVLVALVLVLAVLLLVSVVVGVVVLHQPHLTPVPVPSVSSIS